MSATKFQELAEQILALEDPADPATAATAVLALADAIPAHGLEPLQQCALVFMCSSLTINAGATLRDKELLEAGRARAQSALEVVDPDQPLYFQLQYNVANAMLAICDLGLPTETAREEWEPKLIDNRVAYREQLQTIRRVFLEIGNSPEADPHTRSSAMCNLANMLDHSGRWAEAYDFYLRALEAHPGNGNAAGNLAQLLASRIHSGIGQTSHIAAVYDKYVSLAQSLRDGTLEFASAAVADRWDQLSPTGSLGHLSHGTDEPDAPDLDYRLWVAENRLALSPAVEGLGTDDLRWDSAAIEVLYGTTPEEVTPPILGEMNVLKSDFLVSRRLAFEGETTILDGPEQVPDDSGLYIETLDYSLYGIQYSKVLLAQRSALDVLDKTAVVANGFFNVGDVPTKVQFRGFWTTKTGELRPMLVKGPGRSLATLALAELAYDMERDGMYADSQALRNAGTHRIVHAAFLDPTGITAGSRSKIDVFQLLQSTILALQVTRSAFLYLIDLVAAWNQPADFKGEYVPVSSLFYLNDPTVHPDLHSEQNSQPESDGPGSGGTEGA